MSDEFVAAAGIHPGALVTDQPDSPDHDLADATAENVDRFRQELEARGVEGVVERLPGTSHGFAGRFTRVRPRRRRTSFRARACNQASRRTSASRT